MSRTALWKLPLSAFTLDFNAEQQHFIHSKLVEAQDCVALSQKCDYAAAEFEKRYANPVPSVLIQYWVNSLQAPLGSPLHQAPIKASTQMSTSSQSKWTKSMTDDFERLVEDPIINQYSGGIRAIILATFRGMYPYFEDLTYDNMSKWCSRIQERSRKAKTRALDSSSARSQHSTIIGSDDAPGSSEIRPSTSVEQNMTTRTGFRPHSRNVEPDLKDQEKDGSGYPENDRRIAANFTRNQHHSIKNSPLPPSVEKAYHLKCIELKRRLMEVEENNDAARLRVHRLERGISKIRVERAILLEHLRKRQQEMADLGSDGEDDQPPSPQSREPSAKRKRSSGPADRGPSGPTPETTFHNAFPPPSGPGPSQHPPSYNQAHAYPPNVYPYVPQSDALARHLSTSIPPAAQRPPFPYIHSLPNGTSVMLIAPGTPKPAPWTIQELDPRHHYSPAFETMTLGDQENEIFKREYLPFDAEGKPIILKYDDAKGKYIHIFPGSPDWKDPIVDAVRRDAKDYREPMTPTGKLIKGIGANGSRGVAQGSAPATASAPQSEEASGPAPPVIRPRQSQSQSRGSSMNMEIAQRARREREGKEKEAQTEEQRRTSGLDTVRKDSVDIKNKEDIKLERAYEDEDTGGSAKAVARFPTGGGFMAANR